MFAYMLTFMIVTGSSQPVRVEVPLLRSNEECLRVAREFRASLPRGARMTSAVCTQNGYFT